MSLTEFNYQDSRERGAVPQEKIKPYFELDGIKIYHGDCIEVLPALAQTFDLTVTSPPYNIGKEYEKVLSLSEYIEWSKGWISTVYNHSSSSSSFWLNLGYIEVDNRGKAVPLPYLLWDVVPFYLIQEVVWNYGAGVATKHSFSPRNEKFLWYVKDNSKYIFNLDEIRDPDVKYPNQKKNGKLKCNPLGKNPTDVWQIPKVTSGYNRQSAERTPHPAQFPTQLIERIVLGCSNPNDMVLDCFSGSGSTAEVCLRTGRSMVGIEISEKYCELSAKRLIAAKKSMELAAAQAELFG